MEEKSRSRTGLNALKARVKLKGWSVIDIRTAAAREVIAWEANVRKSLGGTTPQQDALIQVAAHTRLILDDVDAFILAQQSTCNRKKKSVLPIVKDRMTLADQLTRQLIAIGLQRPARANPAPVMDLDKEISRLTAALAEPEKEKPEPEEIIEGTPN
jgi:hypothetical protein